jgi:hypothetical protein
VSVPDHQLHLDTQRTELKDEIEAFVKRTQPLFDKKDRQKTLMPAINEFLLRNFISHMLMNNVYVVRTLTGPGHLRIKRFHLVYVHFPAIVNNNFSVTLLRALIVPELLNENIFAGYK